MATCEKRIAGSFEVETAELLAIREGLLLAKEWAIPVHIVESDALLVFPSLMTQNLGPGHKGIKASGFKFIWEHTCNIFRAQKGNICVYIYIYIVEYLIHHLERANLITIIFIQCKSPNNLFREVFYYPLEK